MDSYLYFSDEEIEQIVKSFNVKKICIATCPYCIQPIEIQKCIPDGIYFCPKCDNRIKLEWMNNKPFLFMSFIEKAEQYR